MIVGEHAVDIWIPHRAALQCTPETGNVGGKEGGKEGREGGLPKAEIVFSLPAPLLPPGGREIVLLSFIRWVRTYGVPSRLSDVRPFRRASINPERMYVCTYRTRPIPFLCVRLRRLQRC